MTDKEILQIDFYDLCGIGALWMTDEEKVKYFRELFSSISSTTANNCITSITDTCGEVMECKQIECE